MRAVLWKRYLSLFEPGSLVLDVGCGSGIDAAFLANRGIRVIGIDASPSMLGKATARLIDDRLKPLVDFRVLDIGDLTTLPPGQFDGIISAFAGLSTIPDLTRFGDDAARLLRPHGTLLVHLLNRWSLWEWLGLVRHRRYGAARRLGWTVDRKFVIGDRVVTHYLWHGHQAYARFFAGRFLLRRIYGLGIFRPPHTVRRLPHSAVRMLDLVERPIRGRRPFYDWGRFFVLELEKKVRA